jgi:dCMP deaminase
MLRPSLDEMYMDMARDASKRATCNRLSVGAILSRDGLSVAGYNGPARGEPECYHTDDRPCDDSVHAEMNVLLHAARLGLQALGSTVYCTHSPCWHCAGALINAGIAEVVFAEPFRSAAGIGRLRRAGVYVRRLGG